MLRFLLKSKIQREKITDQNLYDAGSITIDEKLLEKTDIWESEIVQVINVNTGARFETYAMKSARNNGEICLNGDTARLGEKGDRGNNYILCCT